jgi:hypothetical protein
VDLGTTTVQGRADVRTDRSRTQNCNSHGLSS